MWKPKSIQLVIKLTKLCNLRCKYCYEYPYLGDKRKIELTDIEKMFQNILPSVVEHSISKVEFVFHGGEPFLLSASYYRSIFEMQQRIFGQAGILFQNVVQTNLINLKPEHVQLIKDDVISGVGVSIDLFGEERVNQSGKSMDHRTLANMDILAKENIFVSVISVLSGKTAPFYKEMFAFFDKCNTTWRLLPIDLTGYEGQHDDNLLTAVKLVKILKDLFDQWIQSESAIKFEPINEYMDIAISFLNSNETLHKFSKETDDSLFIINTNGQVFCEADAYNDLFAYGNIFTTPFSALLSSSARKRAIERANLITGSVCNDCMYYGHCSGFRMAESTTEKLYWDVNGNISCTVIKPMVDYIVEKLTFDNTFPLSKGSLSTDKQLAVL
ncbi:radical SAM protein [Pedobacter changchengzhani]|nr:radical SAM protein [Pedobacter changchengzhani]